MTKKTVRDVRLAGKRVLLRVAWEVPLEHARGRLVVADDRRIRETLPTLRYLLRARCRVACLSYLGRPGGKRVAALSMEPVAAHLAKLLGRDVTFIPESVGPVVERCLPDRPGSVAVLENVRFHPEEEANSVLFTRRLARPFDLVVFDAFAQAHRSHASTVGLVRALPAVAGLLVEKEYDTLTRSLDAPRRPFVVIIGGAKLSDKVTVLEHVLRRADAVLVGGAVSNMFLAALGKPVGKSFLSDRRVDGRESNIFSKARRLAKSAGAISRSLAVRPGLSKLVLPVDLIASTNRKSRRRTVVNVSAGETIVANSMFLDIGPQTVALFQSILSRARTVAWNGPLGYFESPTFARGTVAVGRTVVSSRATSLLGGGDSERIRSLVANRGSFTFVSTGGGAFLTVLAGEPLPAIAALPSK